MSSKVLIVDDQSGIRFLLDIVIKEEGYHTALASNGLEAIEKVKQLDPEIVFMDIKMPLMDGIEALAEIKKISNAKVILMSAYTDKDSFERAKDLGAFMCIGKPFDVNNIKVILHEIALLNNGDLPPINVGCIN